MKSFCEIIKSDRVEKISYITEKLESLNERGINLLLCAAGVTEDNEEYDIHTSQERLDELASLNKEKKELSQRKFKEENRIEKQLVLRIKQCSMRKRSVLQI
jgi:hypothetical protein